MGRKYIIKYSTLQVESEYTIYTLHVVFSREDVP